MAVLPASASSSTLIDDHVSTAQCTKAVDALLKHTTAHQEKVAENELLPGAEPLVWLVLAVKKMTPEKKLKPFKIPLAHPLVDPRTSGVCLITKDPQREYKDLLEAQNIKFISRVLGIEKLKGKWKPFEARRLLLRENGLFLADERVVPLLPKLLGKAFFQAKKQPIPVCITRKDLKGELERAVSSTYMHQNQGTCTSIKVGILSQTSAQVVDNLRTALPAIIKKVNGGWENVQSLHLKTSASVALPIWSCKLGSEDGGRWDGLSATAASGKEVSEADDADEMDEEESNEEVEPVAAPMKKGKKRAAEKVVDEETAKPAKKAKSAALVPVNPASAAVETLETATTAMSIGPTSGKKTKKTKVVLESSPVAGTQTKTTQTTIATPNSVEETTTTVKIGKNKAEKSKTVETTTVEKTVSVIPAAAPAPTITSSAKGKAKAILAAEDKALESTPPKAAKGKKAAAAPSAPTPTLAPMSSSAPPTPSKADMKAKKAIVNSAGEAKKQKVLAGGKGVKERTSAKAGLLGKKK